MKTKIEKMNEAEVKALVEKIAEENGDKYVKVERVIMPDIHTGPSCLIVDLSGMASMSMLAAIGEEFGDPDLGVDGGSEANILQLYILGDWYDRINQQRK